MGHQELWPPDTYPQKVSSSQPCNWTLHNVARTVVIQYSQSHIDCGHYQSGWKKYGHKEGHQTRSGGNQVCRAICKMVTDHNQQANTGPHVATVTVRPDNETWSRSMWPTAVLYRQQQNLGHMENYHSHSLARIQNDLVTKWPTGSHLLYWSGTQAP